MNTIFANHNRRTRGFVAMLGILVVVAIMLVIIFIQARGFFQPTGNFRSWKEPGYDRPWLEKDRILPASKPIPMPFEPKPVLDNDIDITAPVTLDGQDRGAVTLSFNNRGEVRGSWETAYEYPGEKYTYTAEFAGNVDIEKTWEDKTGPDKSKLYFIAMGDYTKTLLYTKQGNTTTENGTVYVTGYMNPDYSVFGRVTLTTDETWSAHYDFSSAKK